MKFYERTSTPIFVCIVQNNKAINAHTYLKDDDDSFKVTIAVITSCGVQLTAQRGDKCLHNINLFFTRNIYNTK